MNVHIKLKCLSREPLLKGKTQYSLTPCTDKFRWAAFDIATINLLFYNTRYLNEEVNCTEPSPSVSVPCIRKDCFQVKSNLLTDSRFTTHMNIMILN